MKTVQSQSNEMGAATVSLEGFRGKGVESIKTALESGRNRKESLGLAGCERGKSNKGRMLLVHL